MVFGTCDNLEANWFLIESFVMQSLDKLVFEFKRNVIPVPKSHNRHEQDNILLYLVEGLYMWVWVFDMYMDGVYI